MIWISIFACIPLLEVLAQGPPRPPKLQVGPPKQPPRPPGKPSKKPIKAPILPPKNPSASVNPGAPSKKPSNINQPSTGPTQTSVEEILAQAKIRISATIAANPPIAATYLRLGFHDCVPNGVAGGCDGCVNVVSNTENQGLQPAIQSLSPIVAALENKSLGVTRADLWAFAALVAVESSQSTVVFTDNFRVGRKNCETVGTCSGNDPTFCASNGPDVATDFPSSDLTTQGLIRFMSEHFGYNADQTVAIMGAHSIGRTLPNNSGFQGSWDNSNLVLGKLHVTRNFLMTECLLNWYSKDNAYYRAIVGSPDPVLAPDWVQITLPTNKIQWAHPVTHTNVMLNADIAIVRDLGIENDLDVTGRVQCSFRNNPFPRRCPIADTLTKAAIYRNDNGGWLVDFKNALKIMLEKGLA
jgi:hypothetical protein